MYGWILFTSLSCLRSNRTSHIVQKILGVSSRVVAYEYRRDITSASYRWKLNQFNDRTWIHFALRHFTVIPNELTSGTDVSRLSRALLKSVSQEDHLVGGESQLVATTSLVVHLLQIRAAYKKALLSPKAPRVLERQVERVTYATFESNSREKYCASCNARREIFRDETSPLSAHFVT